MCCNPLCCQPLQPRLTFASALPPPHEPSRLCLGRQLVTLVPSLLPLRSAPVAAACACATAMLLLCILPACAAFCRLRITFISLCFALAVDCCSCAACTLVWLTPLLRLVPPMIFRHFPRRDSFARIRGASSHRSSPLRSAGLFLTERQPLPAAHAHRVKLAPHLWCIQYVRKVGPQDAVELQSARCKAMVISCARRAGASGQEARALRHSQTRPPPPACARW